MLTDNIRFQSDALVKFFDGHRDKWDEFYPSEQWAFQTIADERAGRLRRVLDVGCATGGLGLALSSRFAVDHYTGVDINRQVIEQAQKSTARFSIPATFYCDDILTLDQIPSASFEIVASLGCADWNIATQRIIDRCWQFVAPGGCFVMSVRLTDRDGINDFARSHQPIAHDSAGNVIESANYVVFNWREYLRLCARLSPPPATLSGYGYWGKPASNAVTPYDRLVFGVIIVRKAPAGVEPRQISVALNLPLDLLTAENERDES